MKKSIILLMTLLFSVTIVLGQNTKEEVVVNEKQNEKEHEVDNVSNLTKENFYSDFGDVSEVKWDKDEQFEVAKFHMDGKDLKAFYNNHSELVGTTQHVTFADIPERAQKEIEKKYNDYEVEAIIFFDNNEANQSQLFLYGSQFADEDNYFVVLKKENHKIVIQVNSVGRVFFFKELD